MYSNVEKAGFGASRGVKGSIQCRGVIGYRFYLGSDRGVIPNARFWGLI